MSKKKKIFLTNHSKVRFNERTDYETTGYELIAATAFRKGYEFSRFSKPLADYLKSISFNSGKYVAKIYDNKVFIFNNCNGSRLLTVYNVPEEYLPVEQYLIQQEELRRCLISLTNKINGQQLYWGEFGLTDDIAEAIEFTSQIKATNYLNNNYELDSYKNSYDIALI